MTEIERLREALYKALRAYQLGEHPDNSIAIGALTLDLSAVYLAVESTLAATPPGAERGEALALVNEQAEDDGLWFQAETITEDILQRALRKLHAAVESDAASPPASEGEK